MLLYIHFVNLFIILTIKHRGQNPASGVSISSLSYHVLLYDMPHLSSIAGAEL